MAEPGPPPRPDLAIGAIARAKKLRFRRKPKVEVRYTGESRVRTDERIEKLEHEAGSLSERRNLPDEVEPGVTYRDVEVGWVAGARLAIRDERGEGARRDERNKRT